MANRAELHLGVERFEPSELESEVCIGANYVIPLLWFSLFETQDIRMAVLSPQDEIEAPFLVTTLKSAANRARGAQGTVHSDAYLSQVLGSIDLMVEALDRCSTDKLVVLDCSDIEGMHDADEFRRWLSEGPGAVAQLVRAPNSPQLHQILDVINGLQNLWGFRFTGLVQEDRGSAVKDAEVLGCTPEMALIAQIAGWPWHADKLEELQGRWQEWLVTHRPQGW